MKFLDELDNALDNLWSGEAPASEVDQAFDSLLSGDPSAAVQDTPDDLLELHQALSKDQLIPIAALARLLNQFPRRYMLAALVGSLSCLKGVDKDPNHLALIDELLSLLKTRKQQVRKVLRKTELASLQQLLNSLAPEVQDKEVADLKAYMNILVKIDEIQADEVLQLFSASLWRCAFIQGAPLADITRLSNLNEHQATALKTACEGA